MKQLLLIIVGFGLLVSSAFAQSLTVVSSSPADGSTSVALQTTVSFTFSEAVTMDTFDWEYGIGVEPYDKIAIIDSSLSNDNRTLNLVVDQEPNTDYIWFVLAIAAGGTQSLNEPYVLTYTTAETIGQRKVSGTVTPYVDATAKAVTSHWPDVKINAEPVARLMSKVIMRKAELRKAAQKALAEARQKSLPVVQQDPSDYHHTIAYLLTGDVFGSDTTGSDVAAATVIDPDNGSYTINYVRPGVYWPFAVKYSAMGMDMPADLGFYDSNFDGVPDSIVVEDTDVTGVDMNLYPYRPLTAGEGLTRARNRARKMEGNPHIKAMYAFDAYAGMDSWTEEPTTQALPEISGANYIWLYYAYTAELNRTYMLMSLPYGVAGVDTLMPDELDIDFNQAQDLPDTFIDSDEAIQIAENNGGRVFRNAIENYTSFMAELWGGHYYSLYDDDPTPNAPLFWKVKYYTYSFNFETFELKEDSMIVFMDLETGTVLKKTTTDIEAQPPVPFKTTLGQNYPNPFNPGTVIPFSLKQAGNVKLEVFNMLGQHVATLVDGVRAAGPQEITWNASGLTSGVYLYRLETPEHSIVRSLILMK